MFDHTKWIFYAATCYTCLGDDEPAAEHAREIIARRGKQARNIAKVAAARQLLTLVFYGLRDGQIRCLSPRSGQPATTGAEPTA